MSLHIVREASDSVQAHTWSGRLVYRHVHKGVGVPVQNHVRPFWEPSTAQGSPAQELPSPRGEGKGRLMPHQTSQ